jgi:hypothetical protein
MLCLLLGGCVTTELKRPIQVDTTMRIGRPSLAWDVLDAGGLSVGRVVLFEARDVLEPIYIVRNAWQQDLGRVDQLGRAYRYVPHAKEAAWVGSGTLTQGVERILQRPGCQLLEIEIEPETRAASPGELETRRADGFGLRSTNLSSSAAPSRAPKKQG